MARGKAKEDDPIMVALISFIYGPRGENTVVQGNTYRRSHPAVKEMPSRFAPWLTTTSDELEEKRRALG
jgi:hypothetical protein